MYFPVLGKSETKEPKAGEPAATLVFGLTKPPSLIALDDAKSNFPSLFKSATTRFLDEFVA